MSDTNDPWPADDPWWRFTPKNPAVGYLSVVAALICLGSSVLSLVNGNNGTAGTVFFVAFGLLAVLWLVRSVSGLMAVRRRRARR